MIENCFKIIQIYYLILATLAVYKDGNVSIEITCMQPYSPAGKSNE